MHRTSLRSALPPRVAPCAARFPQQDERCRIVAWLRAEAMATATSTPFGAAALEHAAAAIESGEHWRAFEQEGGSNG